MANPEHVPELDGFDRMTVRLYRSGLMVAAGGVVVLAGLLAAGRSEGPALVVILAGTLLSVLDMHLYDKRVRWVIAAAGQLGALLMVAGGVVGVELVGQAGLGFLFVALSGFALKEQFCFRIPGLRLVPLFLAVGLVPWVLGVDVGAAVLFGLASLPLAALGVAKWRMPLHFDVGNKAFYQV
ncbi:MAG: DUF2301 domain-containing membrane protein [Myxococcota bacterium]